MKKRLGIILAIVLLVGAFAACGQTAPQAPADSGPAANESTGAEPAPLPDSDERGTINIGVISSISGTGSSIGAGQRKAALMAIDEINANGGVTFGGQTYNFVGIPVDDETQPEVAIRRVNEMKREQNVTLTMGGSLGNISTALNRESVDNSFFFIASNGIPEVFFKEDEHSKTAFCITIITEFVGRGACSWMIEQAGAKKIACLMPDYSIGQGTMYGFESMIDELIGQYPDVTYEVVWHPVGTADLSPYIIQCRDFNPDFLFIGSWADDAITALKQCHEMGVKDQTDILHFWLMDEFAQGIPAEAIAGVYGQMMWYHDMSGFRDTAVVDETRRLSDMYFNRYGETIGPYAMSSYYAINEFKRGLELGGSTDPIDFRNAILSQPQFFTAKGNATWQEAGIPLYDYSAWIVQGLGLEERQGALYGTYHDFAKIVYEVPTDRFVPAGRFKS